MSCPRSFLSPDRPLPPDHRPAARASGDRGLHPREIDCPALLRQATLIAAGAMAGAAMGGTGSAGTAAQAAESLALSFELGDREAVIVSIAPSGENSTPAPLEASFAPPDLPPARSSARLSSLQSYAATPWAAAQTLAKVWAQRSHPGVSTETSSALPAGSDPIPAQWWQQGSASPIAIAIGNAEGTRDLNGSKTNAYYWHRDPGNGADNFGTFSYQHLSAAMTAAVQAEPTAAGKRQVAAAQQLAEISDRQQLQRLQTFYTQLQRQAQQRGLSLTPLEVLNGLDLINQSEAAGLAPGGYVDRLAELKAVEADAEEQIREARTWAYWHPERQAWDAPGLGNNYPAVRRDQDRRFEAVKQSLARHYPWGASSAIAPTSPIARAGDNSGVDPSTAPPNTTPNTTPNTPLSTEAFNLDLAPTPAAIAADADAIADLIIFGQSQEYSSDS